MHRSVLYLALVACAAFALVWPIYAVAASASPPATTPVYLALGDSYAAGVGATDFIAPRSTRLDYVAHFGNFLRGAAHSRIRQTIKLAVPGEDTSSFFTSGQWQSARDAIADPITDIGVVTLTLGGNNLLSLLDKGQPCDPRQAGPGGPSTECLLAVRAALQAFPAQYVPVLRALQASLAAEKAEPSQLIVTTYPNPFSGTSNTAYAKAVDAALLGHDLAINCEVLGIPSNVGLNDLIACLGQQNGATIADIYPAFEGKGPALTHINELDIHPNNAGYAQIATVVRQTFRGR